MKPLWILLGAFVGSLLVTRLVSGSFDYFFAGKAAMSAMLLFTAIGHFAFSKGMALMIPDFIPFKKALVYATGFIEIAAAIGLLLPSLQQLTARLLILFFILILPANINAAIKHIDYQTGATNGKGLAYLWLRVPLQILFLAWVYFFALQ